MANKNKPKTLYLCQSCGNSSPKWLGKCPSCEAWNSFAEEKVFAKESSRSTSCDPTHLVEFDENAVLGKSPIKDRISTRLPELDRVLGGGIVPDSFVLIGGDPGIGKSTLLLQVALSVNAKVLYVSGEESTEQIQRRAVRIQTNEGKKSQLFVASDNVLENVIDSVEKISPEILIVDSLQTFATLELDSSPGSVGQLREVTAKLMKVAKSKKIAVFLVGHVTKDGSIAGPKVVEHMVDTVLYFEGDDSQSYRLLRAVKNRFGEVRELGVFEMKTTGLEEVKNPSSLFLSDRKSPVSGTTITNTIEGSRPLLIELQALIVPSVLAVPRRTTSGIDHTRISLIAAILERHMELPLANLDLFFNVAGGFRLSEPAADLAAAVSIWSSVNNVPIPTDTLFIGELALTGEVRRVSQVDSRVEEAKRQGFKRVILPANCLKQKKGLDQIGISHVRELDGLLRDLFKVADSHAPQHPTNASALPGDLFR